MGRALLTGRTLAFLLTGLFSSSCASAFDPGAGLRANALSAEMRALVAAARAGDKLAQLELGERFEEGRGVAVDLARARKLYAAAAADSGGRIWVYSPPVRGGGTGRAIPVERGPAQPGLAEAARRLAALRNRARR